MVFGFDDDQSALMTERDLIEIGIEVVDVGHAQEFPEMAAGALTQTEGSSDGD